MKSESDARDGRVVTFYSYKGGTGRSMALANVAWLLALHGKRVLLIDWDLEAPGLHRYFHPFLADKELTETKGLVDYLSRLAAHSATAETGSRGEVDVIDYIVPLEWPEGSPVSWDFFGELAAIHLMPAGRQGPAYSDLLGSFSLADFYERLGGRQIIRGMRERLREIYDYVLIDSRTGLSDTSGICTVEMADTLVTCFTLNTQSIAGASAVSSSVLALRKAAETAPAAVAFRIFPVPTRVDRTEKEKRDVSLELAKESFAPFLGHLKKMRTEEYWGRVEIPYVPYYAFEEIPSIFGDDPHDRQSLTSTIQELASAITDGEIDSVPELAKREKDAGRIRKEILGWYERRPRVQRAYSEILEQAKAERLKAAEALAAAQRHYQSVRWVAVFSVFAVMLIAGGYFVQSYIAARNEAAAAKDAAARKRALSIADGVYTQSGSDPVTAALLIHELKDQSGSAGLSRQAFQVANQPLPSLVWREEDPFSSLEFAPDDRHVVALTVSGAVKVLETTSWRTVGRISDPTATAKVVSASFRDSGTVATLDRNNTVALWTLDGKPTTRRPLGTMDLKKCGGPEAQALVKHRLTSAQLGFNYPVDVRVGDRIFVRYDNVAAPIPGALPALPVLPPLGTVPPAKGNIAIFDLDGKCLEVYADPTRDLSVLGTDGASAAAFSRVAAAAIPSGSASTKVSTYTTGTRALASLTETISSALLSADGRRLIALPSGIGIGSYLSIDPTLDKANWSAAETGSPIAVSAKGNYLLLAGNFNVGATLKSPDKEWLLPSVGGTPGVAFDRAEKHLLLTGSDGTVRLWDIPRIENRTNPPQEWSALVSYLDSVMKACLDEEQRRKLLQEDRIEAGNKAEACRRQKSLPGETELGDTQGEKKRRS